MTCSDVGSPARTQRRFEPPLPPLLATPIFRFRDSIGVGDQKVSNFKLKHGGAKLRVGGDPDRDGFGVQLEHFEGALLLARVYGAVRAFDEATRSLQ